MPRISKKLSTSISLALAVIFFAGCLVGLFVLPALTQMLVDLPDHIGNRGAISQGGRALCLVCAYAIVLDMMLADALVFLLVLLVRRGEVFTDRAVSLLRGISWSTLGLCVPFGILGMYFQLSWIACVAALFLGICLRVCKNAFEEATAIKQENDLTV